MIPIAIVWETRKSYIKSTDAYKGLAQFVFKSFGYKIWCLHSDWGLFRG